MEKKPNTGAILKLNMGSGDRRIEGWINIDHSPACHPDYVWDITNTPYPEDWATNVAEIRADNLCEHLEPRTLIKVINYWNSILVKGGKLWIRVPVIRLNEKCISAAFRDPTHVNYFTEDTFVYFDSNHTRHKMFGKDYGIVPWKLIRQEVNDPFLIVELIKI